MTKITSVLAKEKISYSVYDQTSANPTVRNVEEALALYQKEHCKALLAIDIIMDNIPYETDRSYLQDFCAENGIRLHILHSSFDESTDPRKTRCFLCAWNRRKTLFEFAVNNGFNKIALGHHMDDILVTLLMNITFEGSHSTMQPSLSLKHYPLTIIRPLCLVHEADIRQVAEELHFTKQKALCPYEETTRRSDMQQIFQQLEQLNPEARYSLWRAMMNK